MLRRVRNIVGDGPRKLARDAGKFWSASASEGGVQDMSHWRGQGRWADDVAWLEIGRSTRARFEELKRATGGDAPFVAMAEWGPGGGSNAIAFSELFPAFYGVDISAANLEECARQLRTVGYDGFRAVHFEAAQPESVRAKITEPLDFFLSVAVFQHFPGKEYGLEVTRIAFELLRPGGLALIQTRYDDGTGKYASHKANYRQNFRTFTAYTIDEYWREAEQAGFRAMSVSLLPGANYAFYSLQKPRSG